MKKYGNFKPLKKLVKNPGKIISKETFHNQDGTKVTIYTIEKK